MGLEPPRIPPEATGIGPEASRKGPEALAMLPESSRRGLEAVVDRPEPPPKPPETRCSRREAPGTVRNLISFGPFATLKALRSTHLFPLIPSMKNDLIEARLRRDTTAAAFLAQATADYADIEADVAPLRDQLGANLTRAGELAQQVLGADNDGNPARKKGLRNQLTALLQRLILAGRAAAQSSKDAELRATLGNLDDLRNLNESTFQEEATRLLGLIPGREPAFTKRRFSADHAREARQLLQEFTATTTEGRLNDTNGSTGRQALERLIKESARLLEEMKVYFDLYKADDPDLWQRFQAATKVVKRGGGRGANPA